MGAIDDANMGRWRDREIGQGGWTIGLPGLVYKLLVSMNFTTSLTLKIHFNPV